MELLPSDFIVENNIQAQYLFPLMLAASTFDICILIRMYVFSLDLLSSLISIPLDWACNVNCRFG